MAINELLPALTHLEVHSSDVSVMAGVLQSGLAVNTSLHTLDMTRNNLDDEGACLRPLGRVVTHARRCP